MTTIATDGVTVAYDSRTMIDYQVIISDKTNKLIIKEGVYFVGCGSRSDVNKIIDSYLSGECDESMEGVNSIVWVSNGNGELWAICIDEGRPITQSVEWVGNAAIGSGADFALAALDFEKTPVQAVKYAMTRNSSTGGKVNSFKLKRPKNK